MNTKENFVAGIYYETPEGELVKTYGFHRDNGVHCVFEDKTCLTVPWDEVKDWKPREDVKFFPNTPEDERPIAYAFDLHWDVKNLKELKRKHKKLKRNVEELKFMEELMEKHNIKF